MNRFIRAVKVRSLWVGIAVAVTVAAVVPTAAQAKPSHEDWWVYVHNNKASDINALLSKGADPNVRFANGQPAIMRAVVDQAWDVFDVLAADPRTDVNILNPANETPLMYLAVAGQTARAKSLIARGAQVNRLGWTPLHYAASKGQIDMARLLLANKAMANAPSPDGTTPIMMAAFSGSMPMVQLLLEAGADIRTKNVKGQNSVDWAMSANQTHLTEQLQSMIASADNKRRPVSTDIVPSHSSMARDGLAVPPDTTKNLAGTAESRSSDGDAVRGVSGVRLNNYD